VVARVPRRRLRRGQGTALAYALFRARISSADLVAPTQSVAVVTSGISQSRRIWVCRSCSRTQVLPPKSIEASPKIGPCGHINAILAIPRSEGQPACKRALPVNGAYLLDSVADSTRSRSEPIQRERLQGKKEIATIGAKPRIVS
jgi:hypothetical protein